MKSLVKLYISRILSGDMDISDVPTKLRDEVKEELEKLNMYTPTDSSYK